ncbi:phage head completion protein [Kordiimonas marina]|uniref:phage head completion protein n=1 Tax=Kordiimonas marina TaxID=2872312 RepID=UPI001FF324CF|nr:head-tail adaptor protein [Kordiimonas marina]MCJ9428690.1 head-tail adaptor protein [Kordiimonas marina]
MTVLGDFRDRITLMREEKLQGAGGRMTLMTPIIADAWAQVVLTGGSLSTIASRQELGVTATIRTHAGEGYGGARRIAWQGRTFRVTSSRATGADRRFLEFSASEIMP